MWYVKTLLLRWLFVKELLKTYHVFLIDQFSLSFTTRSRVDSLIEPLGCVMNFTRSNSCLPSDYNFESYRKIIITDSQRSFCPRDCVLRRRKLCYIIWREDKSIKAVKENYVHYRCKITRKAQFQNSLSLANIFFHLFPGDPSFLLNLISNKYFYLSPSRLCLLFHSPFVCSITRTWLQFFSFTNSRRRWKNKIVRLKKKIIPKKNSTFNLL